MNRIKKLLISLVKDSTNFLVKSQVTELIQSRYTLSFNDKENEAFFLDSYFKANLQHGRLCHILGMVFYSSFGILDFFLFPETFEYLCLVRFAVVAPIFLMGLTLSYTHFEFYKKYWQFIFTGYVLFTGFGYIAITAFSTKPLGYSQYVGLIYCLIFGYSFIRLRFMFASTAGILLCVGYFFISLWIIKIPLNLLAIQLPHLFGINFLGMFVCYYLELSARSDFHLNSLLKKDKILLDEANMKLEKKVIERTWELEASNKQLKDKIRQLEEAEQARKTLEAQFLQSQKMEAVGRLAGGVAHDYNNMLTVILGYAELIKFRLQPNDPILENLIEIQKAARRSKDITRQLLAFSRQQILSLEVLDINMLISNSEKALIRLIGEDIKLKFFPSKDVWKVKVDPSQIDQILFNLVINARDAMPNGGNLSIKTSNEILHEKYLWEGKEFGPGHFVELTVSDKGSGMDAETMANIFEPFFTTKDSDKGTGLGLATVYGIVKQNNGFLKIDSEPGHGTTFHIYLPQCLEKSQIKEAQAEISLPDATCSILLVEDDDMVRRMVTAMLEKLGYHVIVAETPNRALELLKNNPMEIGLLLTDVVMPEMDGKQLKDKIISLRPEIKTLFMSGYTSDVIAHRGVLDDGVHFIQKPFTKNELAVKVHAVAGVE